MTEPFDPRQPGAIRLRELARRIARDHEPVAVEIRSPVLIDEPRELRPGDRTTVSAGIGESLVRRGDAVLLPKSS